MVGAKPVNRRLKCNFDRLTTPLTRTEITNFCRVIVSQKDATCKYQFLGIHQSSEGQHAILSSIFNDGKIDRGPEIIEHFYIIDNRFWNQFIGDRVISNRPLGFSQRRKLQFWSSRQLSWVHIPKFEHIHPSELLLSASTKSWITLSICFQPARGNKRNLNSPAYVFRTTTFVFKTPCRKYLVIFLLSRCYMSMPDISYKQSTWSPVSVIPRNPASYKWAHLFAVP